MKIALCQIDPTVGDLRGNLELIRLFAARAESEGAELALFPELALGGYPALDLWEEPGYVRANREALGSLARGVREMGLIVGFVDANRARTGKPIHNAAALLHRGRVAAVRHKTLLPTYDVFDEARYFEPARENAPLRYRGRRLGLTICEDAWAPQATGRRRLYSVDPVSRLAAAGAEILLNISASPFSRGKPALRRRLFSGHARRAGRPFLFCNLCGGNDEMVFDGASFALDARGRTRAQARFAAEDLLVVDPDAPRAGAPAQLPADVEQVALALELGLRDYARKCGFSKALLGLSGGIDSALTAALAARALGAQNVTGVAMPSAYSSPGSVADAEALARALGLRFLKLPIAPLYDRYRAALGPLLPSGARVSLAEQNLQSRIRGTLLMALSNQEGSLLLSTGNKSELSVGYCTLYGDMNGGLAVLADVTKRTVYELSRWINRERELIPAASIEKAPSAELAPGQKDQDDLPPYDEVDAIVDAYVVDRLGPEQIARLGHRRRIVDSLLARIDRAEYKRKQAPPSLKISGKAFGLGRRMPIARKSYR